MVPEEVIVDVQVRKQLDDPEREREREQLIGRPQSGVKSSKISFTDGTKSKSDGGVNEAREGEGQHSSSATASTGSAGVGGKDDAGGGPRQSSRGDDPGR